MASPPAATCSTAEWTLNSRGQSPCSVASTIAQACPTDDSFALPPLPEEGGHHYEGPPGTPATECQCNTVYYSLQSACALCQHPRNNFLKWSDYATNCSTTYEGLPITIPSSVSLPAYAYLNVVINDTFNVALAQSPAFRDLDFTATLVRTISTATTTAHVSTSSDESTHTSSSHDGEHDSSSPTHAAADNTDSEQHTSSSVDKEKRAIVGGVVGGICGLILVGGIIVYCLRRRRKKRILSTPLQAVNAISNTTLPLHITTQDEKDAVQQPPNVPLSQLDGSDSPTSHIPTLAYGNQRPFASVSPRNNFTSA